MQEIGADIVKLAVMPVCAKDVLSLLCATEEMSKNRSALHSMRSAQLFEAILACTINSSFVFAVSGIQIFGLPSPSTTSFNFTVSILVPFLCYLPVEQKKKEEEKIFPKQNMLT